MPIKVPDNLPAAKQMEKENIFVMTTQRASTQMIRPLKILLLNLMPTKVETETQLVRLLGNTPLQVEMELLQTASHTATHVSEQHMIDFYKTFDDVKDNYYDGMIITGAPVERLEFEEVEYWEELCKIMEWTKSHVTSTLHVCWGGQAALYYHYGIKKYEYSEKLFGVFKHKIDHRRSILFRGFDDSFDVPHSRYTYFKRADVENEPSLKILASSEEAGVFCVSTKRGRQIFVTGHSEYDADTLKNEYLRDKKAGLDTKLPKNFFPADNPQNKPVVSWRSCANLFYSNWLNYFVYQATPYNITEIKELKKHKYR